MKLIKRDYYLEKLKRVIGTPDIKVITGVRRCGKSKLLDSFRDYITAEFDDINIICVDFNEPEFRDLMQWEKLYEHVNQSYDATKRNFVFIDEVQMCEGFEVAINGLHNSEKFDIYITGSNAFLMSSDLATLFTGRTFEIMVYPFSFSEYMQYYNCHNKEEALDKFMFDGGMPGSYLYNTKEMKYDYLNRIFDTLILRDIKQKHKIRNVQTLDKVVDYLTDNISNLTSSRNIAKALLKESETTSHKTVAKYIDYLCNAFMFEKFTRYDVKGKNYLASNDKFYLCDHSFKYARLGEKSLDAGRILENIVSIELRRRGYRVYIGTLYNKEIDFVAMHRGEPIYFQVSNSIDDPSTFDREIAPLIKIPDAYPRVLLTRTRQFKYDIDGVHIINIADWLLKQD